MLKTIIKLFLDGLAAYGVFFFFTLFVFLFWVGVIAFMVKLFNM